ncbi:STAS domain-containing protein [Spirillospora sp. NPDC047279]|uniref:STAS domain-containing protein n=1 Tax=Spirillospora sp. NPDC047279 TaxID=3155478 RepID=UPI0033E47B3E
MTLTVSGHDGSPARLSIRSDTHNRWTRLRLTGELDLTTVDLANSHFAAALSSSSLIAVDLSGVKFCDSSGVNALVRAWKTAKAHGGRLLLVAPAAQLTRILDITGLGRRLDVVRTLPD